MRSVSQANRLGGFTLVELLVVVAVIAVLVALLLPAVQAARESARRAACAVKAKQIGLGLVSFAELRGYLPPAEDHGVEADWSPDHGKQGFGHCGWYDKVGNWANYIFPFIEQQALFDQLDFEIDGQNLDDGNVRVMQGPMPFYQCPSDPFTGLTNREDWHVDERDRSRIMHYFAVAGPFGSHPVFAEPASRCNYSDCCPHLGPFYNDSRVAFRQVTDGLSKTALIVEVWGRNTETHGPDDRGRAMAYHNQAYFAEPPNTVTECHGLGPVCRSIWRAASFHPAGVHAALADGSVRMIENGVDLPVFQSLATIAGDDDLENRLRELAARGW